MSKRRVAVLFGGPSAERDVSRISAQTIVRAFDPARYEVIPVAMDAEGRFLPPRDAARWLHEGTVKPPSDPGAKGALVPAAIAPSAVDCVFPIVHGTGGEDGVLQGFLETLGVPYVGPGVKASAVGMDKDFFKIIMRHHDIPVVPWVTIQGQAWQDNPMGQAGRAENALDLPVFVKPANGGSSVGVTKVKSWAMLDSAITLALRYDTKVLVEAGIDAREIEVAVLGNENPRASVPGEVIPSREFYDYEDKYVDDKAAFRIPAQLPAGLRETIQQLAVQAFTAAGCEGMARADFFLDRNTQRPYINEINTLPGFTSISMYPKMWEASGLPLPKLLDELVTLALERHERQRRATASRSPPKALR